MFAQKPDTSVQKAMKINIKLLYIVINLLYFQNIRIEMWTLHKVHKEDKSLAKREREPSWVRLDVQGGGEVKLWANGEPGLTARPINTSSNKISCLHYLASVLIINLISIFAIYFLSTFCCNHGNGNCCKQLLIVAMHAGPVNFR